MGRFLGYFILVSLAIYLIQLALAVGLIIVGVAGLIFRPKETIGLLLFLGFLWLLAKAPLATLVGFGVLALISAILTAREKKANRASDDGQMMLPLPDDS